MPVIDIEAGQIFRKPYPFKYWEDEWSSGWAGGCHVTHEEGSEIMDGYYEEVTHFTADGEGEIEYEVLAVAEMPRKFKTRVLYSVAMINPEGGIKKANKCHTVTIDKFRAWIEAIDSSYPHGYLVEE